MLLQSQCCYNNFENRLDFRLYGYVYGLRIEMGFKMPATGLHLTNFYSLERYFSSCILKY